MIARVERALRCAFNKRAQKRALHLERFATETSLVRVRHMENGKSNPVCSKTPSPSAGGRLFSAARRATFSAPTSRKRLHLMRSETGIFLLVFSTHAPHQGAFSRLPCSPRLCGEREKTGNGAATQGSAGAPPWATNISPLTGLGQTLSHFDSWLLTSCCTQRCSSPRSQGYQGPEPLAS